MLTSPTRRSFGLLPLLASPAIAGFVIAATVVPACSDGGAASGFADAGRADGTTGTEDSAVFIPDDASSTATDAADGCSDAAKLVYVVTSDDQLYSFDPAALKFTKLLTLNCGSGSATPNSMAVDRQANAWINYNDGTIWKLDIATGKCSATAWSKAQKGWLRFGMGFSTNGANTTDETLFLNPMNELGTSNTNGLVKVDLTTMAPTSVGRFTTTLATQSAELTGTGDGRLYGFFTTAPASLAGIERTTGATPSVQKLGSLSTGSAWAFSFWGGDFWFYTANGANSAVTRLKTADNTLSTVVANTGMTIVGAGVSTCAPLNGGR
jgi:hypothetical protein